MYGLEADDTCITNASQTNDYTNGCGFHFHVNADCDDAGGHVLLSNSTGSSMDIQNSNYGFSYGGDGNSFVVDSGVEGWTWDNAIDGSIVVHDWYGSRIACHLVSLTPATNLETVWSGSSDNVVPYYNYVGADTITFDGDLSIKTSGNTTYISYTRIDGDADCDVNNIDPRSNSCGIHLHVGMYSISLQPCFQSVICTSCPFDETKPFLIFYSFLFFCSSQALAAMKMPEVISTLATMILGVPFAILALVKVEVTPLSLLRLRMLVPSRIT